MRICFFIAAAVEGGGQLGVGDGVQSGLIAACHRWYPSGSS
jgi:hypothetical protein